MAASEPLANLRDIHLPSAIGWWPLAPGWYVLIALVFLAIACMAFFLWRARRLNKPKKEALLLLDILQKNYVENRNAPKYSAQIAELLKRVALVYYPRAEVAGLHGLLWIDFLNKTAKNIDFQPVAHMLLELPFKTDQKTDITPLFNKTRAWIKQRRYHRV